MLRNFCKNSWTSKSFKNAFSQKKSLGNVYLLLLLLPWNIFFWKSYVSKSSDRFFGKTISYEYARLLRLFFEKHNHGSKSSNKKRRFFLQFYNFLLKLGKWSAPSISSWMVRNSVFFRVVHDFSPNLFQAQNKYKKLNSVIYNLVKEYNLILIHTFIFTK